MMAYLFLFHSFTRCDATAVSFLLIQAKKKELSRLNRELGKAQAELNRQKRLRDDMGPQHIKLKESITTLKRQVNYSRSMDVCIFVYLHFFGLFCSGVAIVVVVQLLGAGDLR